MDLGDFIDTLNEKKLSSESHVSKDSIQNSSVKSSDMENMELWQEMVDIIDKKSNKRFEGDAYSVKDAKRLLELVIGFLNEPSIKNRKKDDEQENEDSDDTESRGMRIAFNRMSKRIYDSYDIIIKKEHGKAISDKDKKLVYDTMEKISDVLFKARFIDKLTRNKKTEQSIHGWIEAFPVRYASKNGKDFYGIIYYRSGIVCWEDMAQHSTLDSKSKDEIAIPDSIKEIESDKEVSMPRVFPIARSEGANTLLVGAPNMKKLMKSGRFTFDDSDAAKEAVKQLFIKNGVETGTSEKSSNKKLAGAEVTDALKKISFWKGIRDILNEQK